MWIIINTWMECINNEIDRDPSLKHVSEQQKEWMAEDRLEEFAKLLYKSVSKCEE
jgi:hypothetical protein